MKCPMMKKTVYDYGDNLNHIGVLKRELYKKEEEFIDCITDDCAWYILSKEYCSLKYIVLEIAEFKK